MIEILSKRGLQRAFKAKYYRELQYPEAMTWYGCKWEAGTRTCSNLFKTTTLCSSVKKAEVWINTKWSIMLKMSVLCWFCCFYRTWFSFCSIYLLSYSVVSALNGWGKQTLSVRCKNIKYVHILNGRVSDSDKVGKEKVSWSQQLVSPA